MAEAGVKGIRQSQLAAAGMIAGVVVFAGIATRLNAGDAAKWGTVDPATAYGVLALVIAGCAVAYVLLRGKLLRDLRARAEEIRQAGDPSSLLVDRYHQFVVNGAGLIEGPCLAAVIVYLLTGRAVVLTLVAVGVVLMAVRFPTRSTLRRLAEQATQT